MTPEEMRGRPRGGSLGMLPAAALIAVLIGAGGSMGLMLYAGHRQNSRILLLLFAIWVLSPFAALAAGYVISNRWSVLTRTTLYSLILVLTVGSLAIYGVVAFGYSTAKVGFVFLIVPLTSWLLIATVVATAAFISSRLARRSDGA